MDALIYILGAIAFFALIMASIALHEVGHLVPGKLFGVKTTQYFVGFGKTLWSTRRGETEYGVKALPLGGYVRLVGMYPPAKAGRADRIGALGGRLRRSNTGPFQSLADQARAAEWDDIRPEDDGRLFYQKKTWQKLIIMAGGPMMNILLAFLMFLGVTMIHGTARQQLTIDHVSECMVPVGTTTDCTHGEPKTPAWQAGVRSGDTIVSFNGVAVHDWDQLSELIRANGAGEARVVVLRDGQDVPLTPVHTVITGVADRWDPSRRIEAGFFGVSPEVALVKGNPVTVVQDMADMAVRTGHALLRFPVKVFYVGYNLVTGRARDENGPMSIVGASRVAGEIASTHRLTMGDKVATGVQLLGAVNLFVALFNFVPLLPLDGGHIAGALYEGLRRWLARVFRRPDPGYVDTARMLPVAYVVGGFIAISGIVLILADLIDPIKLF